MALDDFKVKEQFAMKLWNRLAEQSPWDYPMSSGAYCEVVLNGHYQGLYLLQRRVDRKYLGLSDGQILLKPDSGLAAYDDLSAFKIYLVDVGLLRRLAQLAPTAFGEGNRLFTEFKGALTENFVLQTLITQFEVVPRYWSQNNPTYEVDFLIQRENDIFPVEVKSEANTTSKSLKKFKELFPDQVKLRVRFSLDNLKLDDDVLNIPLFMADQADRLIGLALEKKNSFGQ